MKQKGFTLIELMIVVAIIAIVAFIAVPLYQNYVAKTQVAEGLALASGAKTALLEYRSTTGKWPAEPTTNAHVGLPPFEEISGKYVHDVGVRVYNKPCWKKVAGIGAPWNALSPCPVIYVRFNDNISPKVARGALALIPIDEGGSFSFTCHDTGPRHGVGAPGLESPDLTDYLPSSCKP